MNDQISTLHPYKKGIFAVGCATWPIMKNWTLLCAALIPGLLLGQARQGPKLGLAVASQTAGGFGWAGLPKFGPIVGWSWDLPLTGQAHLLVEPLYVSKGYWTRNSVWNINTYGTFPYLELQALLKLDLSKGKEDGMFLTGGPIYGYALRGRVKEFTAGKKTHDYKAQPYPASQFSVAVGLGTATKRWAYELRAQTSMSPWTPTIRAQNLVISLNLTYRLLSYEERQAKREKKELNEEEQED